MKEALDHAVISVRDRMDRAEAIYRRMGFTLTERGFHTAGSCNHLMVFERDYLELIGFPPAGHTVRPDLIDAPIGLDGLVLATNDAQAVHARLSAAGFAVGAPQRLTRMVHLAKRSEAARFTTVRFPRGAIAGGRLYYCQHETPHLVWNPAWQQHANGARAISAFTIAVPDPRHEAAQYERILGTTAISRGPDTVEVGLSHATLSLTTPGALQRTLGELACDPTDANGSQRDAFMAMVGIAVDDLDRTAEILRAGGFSFRALASTTIAIPAREAMNCTIAFTAGGTIAFTAGGTIAS